VRQNQKGRLKCILGIVMISQDARADTQDQRTVTSNYRRKCELGGFVTTKPESLQELSV
jgi:hypothetical protein